MSTDVKTGDGYVAHYGKEEGHSFATTLHTSSQVDRNSQAQARQAQDLQTSLGENKYDLTTRIYETDNRQADRVYNLDKQNSLYFIDKIASQDQKINELLGAMNSSFARMENLSLGVQLSAAKEALASKSAEAASAAQTAAIVAAIKAIIV